MHRATLLTSDYEAAVGAKSPWGWSVGRFVFRLGSWRREAELHTSARPDCLILGAQLSSCSGGTCRNCSGVYSCRWTTRGYGAGKLGHEAASLRTSMQSLTVFCCSSVSPGRHGSCTMPGVVPDAGFVRSVLQLLLGSDPVYFAVHLTSCGRHAKAL